jgi:Cft2 family RNA processing exonuclease
VAEYTFQSLNLRPEIGGNSYALDLEGTTILLDAGMHPKEEGPDALPRYQELPYDSADAIIISHSHLDHIGTLPVAQRDHPSAPVYLTAPCAALGDALLHNSVNVMTSQRDEHGISEYPLYHHREIDYLQDRWMVRPYEKPFSIDPLGACGTEVTFFDAGHILGSAGVMIKKGNKQIFYTGDVHFQDHTLIKGARFPELSEPDLLIMETTRGADERPTDYTRADQEKLFAEAISAALEAGGSALIPVFAIGKTQEVLTMIDNFKAAGLIPEQTPVFIGGLSTKMTVLYDSFSDSTRRQRPNFEILRDMKLQTGRKRKRAPIEYKPGAIYCLSSGMMSEKTISNVFARGFIQNPANSLLFVGYADPTTPAGVIKNASTGDVIRLDGTHKVQLNCVVDEFDFSGHARREELVDFAVKARPRKLLLVHGDPSATAWFEKELKELLPEAEIMIPQPKIKIPF